MMYLLQNHLTNDTVSSTLTLSGCIQKEGGENTSTVLLTGLMLASSSNRVQCLRSAFKKMKEKKRKEKQFSVAYVITELMLFAFSWLGSHPSRSK